MTSVRCAAITSVAFALGAQPRRAGAVPISEYALESSVASVVKISGARESDMHTSHERPRRSRSSSAHPVHGVGARAGRPGT